MLAAKAGLKLEQLRLGTNPLTNGHLKTEMILKHAPRWLIEAIEHATQRLPGFLSRRINNSIAAIFSKNT